MPDGWKICDDSSRKDLPLFYFVDKNNSTRFEISGIWKEIYENELTIRMISKPFQYNPTKKEIIPNETSSANMTSKLEAIAISKMATHAKSKAIISNDVFETIITCLDTSETTKEQFVGPPKVISAPTDIILSGEKLERKFVEREKLEREKLEREKLELIKEELEKELENLEREKLKREKLEREKRSWKNLSKISITAK
jgi:hypothetical protein